MLKVILHSLGLLIFTSAAATSDPVTVVVSAISAYATAKTTAGAIIYFVSMLALSEVAKSLAPTPDGFKSIAPNGGYDVSGPDPTAFQQVIYGETRVGGVAVFKETSNDDKYLHMVIALAGHECESLEEVYFDDEKLTFNGSLDDNVERTAISTRKMGTTNFASTQFTDGRNSAINGKAKVTFHNGADDQTVDLRLRAHLPKWTFDHRLRGICYAYVELEHDPDYFTNGEPRITFTVKGKKVYDPDTQTTAWSSNPALCLRDYLTNDVYGMGCTAAEIDDTTFIAAKDDCGFVDTQFSYEFDDTTTEADPTSGKFRFNGDNAYNVTKIYFDDLDDGGTDRSSIFSASVGKIIHLEDAGRESINARYKVTVATDMGGYWKLDVDRLASPLGGPQTENPVFADGATINMNFDLDLAGQRYRTNGAFTTDATPENIVNALANSAAGNVFFALGKFQFYAGVSRTASITLDDDDLVSGIKVQTKRSRRDMYNELQGLYKGPETGYQKTDYPLVKSATALTEDQDIVSTGKIDLMFTSTALEANRIAKVLLLRNRQQVQVQARFGLRAANLVVGDWVTYQNNRMSIDGTFEVISWSLAPDTTSGVAFDVILQEVSSTVYSWSDDEEPDEINQQLIDIDGGSFVASLSMALTQEQAVINEHIISVLKAQIAVNDESLLDSVQVQYKLTSEADSEYKTIGQGKVGSFEVRDIEAGAYTVRARPINSVGKRGAFIESAITISPTITQPDDVDDFHLDLVDGMVSLNWTPVTNLDLSYYLVRHALETSSATMASATTAIEKVSRPATSVSVTARKGTYLIRAFDKLGIPSENASSFVITENMLPSYTNNSSQSEHTTFSGTKSNCTVSSSRLKLTSYASQPSSGEYTFSNYIDTGAARRCNVLMECATVRDSGSSLWDDLTGNIDALAGLWDDLTDGDDIVDTDVQFFVSSTEDDPSGSPTWSDYRLFKTSDIYGRAFRFKVKLLSTGDGVTPSIGTLTAKVRYN